MRPIYGIPVCECKTNMRPKWDYNCLRVFVCRRCGRCVPGYEWLWVMRERIIGKEKTRAITRGIYV